MRGGMRWTRHVPDDERCVKRTAKPCGPDASTLASSSVEVSPDDGGNKARSPRRARSRPLKPFACGNAGRIRLNPRRRRSCALFIFAREAAGASGTRHSPRPSGRDRSAKLGRIASRGRGDVGGITAKSFRGALLREPGNHNHQRRCFEAGAPLPSATGAGYGFPPSRERRK
jgi:hypothetical protein